MSLGQPILYEPFRSEFGEHKMGQSKGIEPKSPTAKLFSALASAAKRNPAVAYALSVLPVIGLTVTFSSFYYRHLLAEYEQEISEYEQKVSFQNLEIQNLNLQINKMQPPPADRPTAGLSAASETEREEVTLMSNTTKVLFDTNLKLRPTYYFPTIQNVSFDAVIEDETERVDLYFTDHHTFVHNGFEYAFDLVDVSGGSAKIIVTRKLVN